jgi:hypothetical protein
MRPVQSIRMCLPAPFFNIKSHNDTGLIWNVQAIFMKVADFKLGYVYVCVLLVVESCPGLIRAEAFQSSSELA